MDSLLPEPSGTHASGTHRASPRKQKLTFMLDRHRSVITTGVDSTMEALLVAIGELLRRAIAARKQGVEVPTFLNILRDQANR